MTSRPCRVVLAEVVETYEAFPDLPSQTLRYESSLHPQPPKESGLSTGSFLQTAVSQLPSTLPVKTEEPSSDDIVQNFYLLGVILIRMVYPSYRNPYSLQYSRPGYLLSRPRLGLTVFPRPDCRTTLSLGLPCPVAHGPLVRLNPLCSLQFLSVS
ncbi:hypothetical protein DPEC_G00379140 [Dallia pectoralis]|nr:hypothetical protein DPEC_G00379140 [Dallia pectoralis]